MKATHDIVADPARDLVRMTLAGFFDDLAIDGFIRARRDAHARLRCGPNQHLTFTDVRGLTIQTQDIVGRWGQVLADPTYRSRRLGFVTASTLARMQLQRAIGSRDAQVFTDEREATAWLFADEASAAA